MRNNLHMMYAFWAFALAIASAQLIKPLFGYITKRAWKWHLIVESGGFPSSHTAGVTALSLSIGLREGFSSPLFAVVLAFSIIAAYDAANVRYYAGKNIELTQQLIRDIQDLTKLQFDDPIYLTKIKNVLGHKWIEVAGGFVHGVVVAFMLYWFV